MGDDMRPLETGDPTSVGQGRYRLVGRLGQGGMGVVYFGRSQSGRAVADKVAAARRVGGFHTAPVVDADPDGEPAWLVTAFVPGPTLQAVLINVGSLPTATLTVLAAGLAEALEAIHRAGVMHRDLKPANIIVAEDGPRVIDFGIARALDGTALTQTGAQIGTPGFLAPEQLTGGAVTPAVDIFALGVVLSQSAGAFPFGDGPSTARHYRVVHEEPDLSGVPAELRPLIAACLAKDPADRPTPSQLLSRLTAPQPPGGDWLPAEATAMVRRVETPPPNTAEAYEAAAAAAVPFDQAAPSRPDPAEPPPSAGSPAPPPETQDHPATVVAQPLPGAFGPPAGGYGPANGSGAGAPGPALAVGPVAEPGAPGGPGRRSGGLVAGAVLVAIAAVAGVLVWQPWAGGSDDASGPTGSNAAAGGVSASV